MKIGRISRASLILALTALVMGCDLMPAEEPSAAPAPPPMPPANVAALKIETRDVELEFEYVGQVSASREVEIRARVTGIIDKRLYTEGRLVKAGSLLFQLEPSLYEVQLAQVEAQLLSAEAELKRAEREYRRLKGLTSKSLVSQNEIDQRVETQKQHVQGLVGDELVHSGCNEGREHAWQEADEQGEAVDTEELNAYV